ncbi:alpha/beta fold hydrolase [Novosphingobium lentum]|uniref:alpha/beta fold hydrolase n=1 Tax=Novosphingobium lentum TaxID=145287 RepID=UPI000A018C3F|nr:alpha/beta hydrolase [Novosphingobium lentum]
MKGIFDRRAIPAEASETRWVAPDGELIRRIDWPGVPARAASAMASLGADDAPVSGGTRGSLLFVPGRGDFYEKYLETLDHWHRAGWRVTALDWRGQAGSGRFIDDPLTGHVPDFSVWIADLAAFWAEWSATAPGPQVIVGHSMGGHLVLRALAEKRIDPMVAVLVAPMLGFLTPGPAALLHGVARMMARLGNPERVAWKSSEKPGADPSRRHALLTHDADRYADEIAWRAARPELAMGPGSWRWVERAYASMRGLDAPGVLEAVETPVLMLATRNDGLVGFSAIKRAARRLPRAQLVIWGKEARHELLREVDEVRDRVLHTIDDFFDRLASAPDSGSTAAAVTSGALAQTSGRKKPARKRAAQPATPR